MSKSQIPKKCRHKTPPICWLSSFQFFTKCSNLKFGTTLADDNCNFQCFSFCHNKLARNVMLKKKVGKALLCDRSDNEKSSSLSHRKCIFAVCRYLFK